MKNNRDFALGAGLAGALLLAMPILDLLLRGGGLVAVRAVVAATGLALLALWRGLAAKRGRIWKAGRLETWHKLVFTLGMTAAMLGLMALTIVVR